MPKLTKKQKEFNKKQRLKKKIADYSLLKDMDSRLQYLLKEDEPVLTLKCELCDKPIKVKLKGENICFECFNDQRKVRQLVTTLPCLRCGKLRTMGKPCPVCKYE